MGFNHKERSITEIMMTNIFPLKERKREKYLPLITARKYMIISDRL